MSNQILDRFVAKVMFSQELNNHRIGTLTPDDVKALWAAAVECLSESGRWKLVERDEAKRLRVSAPVAVE